METSTRQAVVSGRFYPSAKEKLIALIRELHEKEKEKLFPFKGNLLLGGIIPHAGYIYSARHALYFFAGIADLNPPVDTFIILCPNHHGYGPGLALDANKNWATPLGKTEIDHDFYEHLNIEIAAEAHQAEHAAEVMLPMMQYYLPYPFKILPVCMHDQTPTTAKWLAGKIHEANKILNKRIMIIASTDFSHYISVEEGKRLDDLALDKISQFDAEGFFSVLCKHDISVCGYGPVMTLMYLAKLQLKKPGFQILSRGHSGEVYPSDEVVHYVAAVVTDKG